MARKTAADLKPKPAQRRAQERSWACVGLDTSMSSLAFVSMIFDATLNEMRGPFHVTKRWIEEDYFERLRQAAYAHEQLIAVTPATIVTTERIYIAVEEPWYYGAVKDQKSEWLKQQAEIAGAAKGALLRWGYKNLHEINNASWRATVRADGVTIRKGKEGKFDIKEWAIRQFGMPRLPDLVKNKIGQKVPRPESGYGAKAKPEQPEDVYDAAGMCAWMMDTALKAELI